MKELYSDKIETVSMAMEELSQDEQKYKQSWARQAKRNVAFANGDQNPAWGAPETIFVNSQPTTVASDNRQNMYCTNEIEPVIRTLVSYMTRSKPSPEACAASRLPEDKNIAAVAEKINQAKYDLDNEYQNSSNAAFWSLTTGTVFGKDFWDMSLGDYIAVLDPMTGEEKIDEMTGQVMTHKSGMNNVAMLTGMTIGTDHSVTDFLALPYINETYLIDVDWAREAFDVDAEGYTGKARDIKEDNGVSGTLQTLEEMKFAIPYLSSGGGSVKSKGKCCVKEWYIRPNRQWPKGRMIVKAGTEVVYSSTPETGSPYYMPLIQTMWHPYTMFVYENYVGRFLGKSLVEQLVPIQMRINEINGAILENANTLAKPNILAAQNQLQKGIINGRGANIYTYKVIPGAGPPEAMQGVPLPSQFFTELQSLIDRIVRIGGTNFVMQGQTPTGVSAASAIAQLLENAANQQSDLMNRWEKFHEQRYTKKIRLIHRYNSTPDSGLNKQLSMMTKDCLDLQIQNFVGAQDLTDGIYLKMEQGSMIPKSEVSKREGYKEVMNGPYLPFLQDPSPKGEELRAQLMEKMNLEPLKSEGSTEIKKAEWENQRILKGLPVEVSPYDIGPIHLPCHKAQIQDPKFLETAPDEVKAALDSHIQEHEMVEQQKAQAEMDAQMAQQMAMQQQGLPEAGAGQSPPPLQ